MSDLSTEPTKSIPLRRAILGGAALLSAGLALGLALGEMSGPSLASAPTPAPAKPGELTNMGTDPSGQPSTGGLSDLARGSQDREASLQSTAPFEIGQPLQKTGPIYGQIASAGAMPLMPQVGWNELNDRVVTVLNTGTPTAESLEQLVKLVSATPPTTPSPIVQTGGPGATPAIGPLPPTVYEGTNKASPN